MLVIVLERRQIVDHSDGGYCFPNVAAMQGVLAFLLLADDVFCLRTRIAQSSSAHSRLPLAAKSFQLGQSPCRITSFIQISGQLFDLLNSVLNHDDATIARAANLAGITLPA
jgi:hypothetical protein